MAKQLPGVDEPAAPLSHYQVTREFQYDPVTGVLSRKRLRLGYVPVNAFKVKIDFVHYATKAIAWFIHYGEWPTGGVSPKNGNERDLRIENLKLVNLAAEPPPRITQERLKELVEYDRDTGEFKRKTHGGVGYPVGSVMNRWSSQKAGYRFKLDNRMYCAHHLAVLYETGKWPEYGVKFVDGNKFNLKWDNIYYYM